MNFMGDLLQCQVNNGRGIAFRARIGHVKLRVTDLDRATDFYREVLGLIVTCYGPTIGLPIVFLAFGDYHHHLALNWFYDDRSDSKPARHGGLNHFAIVHADELSLANAVQRLSMRGGRIEDARDHGSTYPFTSATLTERALNSIGTGRGLSGLMRRVSWSSSPNRSR